MSFKLELFTAIALVSFDSPTEAHDIYSPLKDRGGKSCCDDGDCRPAPYRMTPAGVQMFVEGEWIGVPDSTIQYRALPEIQVKQTGAIGAGVPNTGRATGWAMQPIAPSYRQTRQRFLDQRSPFVKAVSSLFPNDDYENSAN